MTRDNSIQVVIRAKNETGRIFRELRQDMQGLGSSGVAATSDVTRGMQQMGKEASGLSRVLSNIGQQMVATAAGFLIRDVIIGSWQRLRQQVVMLGTEMIGVNRRWEIYQAQYFVQLGRSYDLAERRMREIEEFAVRTPFEIEEIIRADQLLQVFGMHSEQAAKRFGRSGEQIRTIAGDIAAGTRGTFEEVSMWLGRFAAGDTGMALQRFQELGVLTRQELRQMGVEFNAAGALVTPVDEAFTKLLALAEQKFGGLMEIEAKTLQGMESNLADFMTRQKRMWGEPIFELYKDGLRGLLGFLDTAGAQGMLEVGRNLWGNLIGSLRDSLVEAKVVVGGWVSQALLWGEEIALSLAEGIGGPVGVMQVGRAVGNLAREVQRLLEPGSPPKAMPELTNWGAGAARAWLEGWSGGTAVVAPFLQDMLRSMEPYLKQIEAGQEWDVGGFREAFGAEAVNVEGYIWAFERVHNAVQEVASAREALAEAEETGSEEDIEAARERLGLAETEETRARGALQAEQQRLAQRVTSEMELTKAVREQTAAIVQQARVESDAAAARAAADAARIAQARLQLELTEAETPTRQLEIWRRELAATQAGTVEWYQIRTTMVRLEQQIRKEQEGTARAGRGFLQEEVAAQAKASELEKLKEEQRKQGLERARELQGDVNYQAEQAARAGQTYDPDPAAPGLDAWWAVGKAIAGRLWDGFEVWAKARWDAWTAGAAEWASSPETVASFIAAGEMLGSVLGTAIAGGLEGLGDRQADRARAEKYWQEQGEEELARAGGVFASVEKMIGGSAEGAAPSLGEAMATLAGSVVAAFFDAFEQEFEERGGLRGLWLRATLDERGERALAIQTRNAPWLHTEETRRAMAGVDVGPGFPSAWDTLFGLSDEAIPEEALNRDPSPFAMRLTELFGGIFGRVTAKDMPEVAALGQGLTDEVLSPIETGFPTELQAGVDASFAGLGTAAAGTAGARLGAALLESLMRALGLDGAGRGGGGGQGRPSVSHYAGGTSYASGGLAIVGEQGPELVMLPRGSQVLDNRQTMAATRGSQTTHNWLAGSIQIVVTGGDATSVRTGVLDALRAAGVTV